MEFLKDVSPREYQTKILETCIEKNCLVVLPTGLGKTLIALMLSIDRAKKFPGQKIVFLAPTRPLAEQHLKYFEKHLPELFADMQLFTGEVDSVSRKKIWQTADIIFSTPQCIANDVKNGLYNLKDVCLLVVDEAHRCLKNYSYTYVAKKYIEQGTNKRILGLTASPGSEASKIKEICRNLSVDEVELRTRDSIDVKNHLQEVEYEKIVLDFPEKFDEIRMVLKKLFDGYVVELRAKNILFGNSSKIELINLQKRISMILSGGNKNFSYFHAASSCAQAIKIQHALELLETQTLKGFNKYLNELFTQAREKKSKGVSKLVSSLEFGFIFAKSNELLALGVEHPKVQKLFELISSEIQNNEKAKIIVFTQFRDTAAIISEKLNSIPNVKSKIFVGQMKRASVGGETGLSQKEQKKVIEEFSNGEINVICATSIGEEGLDIPEVNAVIFYEAVASAIRKIQRGGRTARLMKGKIIMLLTKKTRDENLYYVSRSREKKMYSAISSVKEDLINAEKKKQADLNKFF